VLKKAEGLIAVWDQDGGMTYRELALALYNIYHGVSEGDSEGI